MRIIPTAIAARRAARQATVSHMLVWIAARNRQTGATETLGLWTGDDHHTFSIGAEQRLYYGAGNILECDPIQASTGLEVRSYEVRLAASSPEVLMAVRAYDARFAPIEMHRAEFDDHGALLAAPERTHRGSVDEAPFTFPEEGGEEELRLRIVSEARGLTLFAGATKSDACQMRRQGDRFRRYGSVGNEVEVAWGELRGGGGGRRLTFDNPLAGGLRR